MFMKVKLTNTLNAIAGRKPTIDRINERDFNKKGKYYVGPSAKGNFLQVNDGLHIRYYDNPFPVFHNLYRIVSKNGNDFVVHEARR
jgi:hypothetical protein|tara:strand:+ start:213 stop:470 length:258 start_codon:yes stop_codon:yes gene_type:complete